MMAKAMGLGRNGGESIPDPRSGRRDGAIRPALGWPAAKRWRRWAIWAKPNGRGGELYERNFNDHTPSTQACTSLCKAKQPNHAIARPSQANAPPIFDGGMMMGRSHHSIAPPIKDGGIDGGGALGGGGVGSGSVGVAGR